MPQRLLNFTISILLLIAISKMPYGYYTFLRIIVTGYSVFLVWHFYKKNVEFWMYLFIGIAVLFNPFIIVSFPKNIWATIDLVTAILFLINIKWLPNFESKKSK